MSRILNLETSTTVCSVSISENGACKCFRENFNGNNHSELIGVFVKELLEESGLKPKNLDAVSLSIGPGSYTGLRIGTSFAKGLCYATEIPLITIPTLKIIAQNAIEKHNIDNDALLCPMIDARRMEVYAAVFSPCDPEQSKGAYTQITETAPAIIDEKSFAEYLEQGPCLFIGDGAGKCADVIRHPNAHFCQCHPNAAAMLVPAMDALKEKRFEDVAYFEPFYLKEFVATVSKKKLW
jgi:tRNA threonylcarbamoyladenosine biosynthesis protein TsaB